MTGVGLDGSRPFGYGVNMGIGRSDLATLGTERVPMPQVYLPYFVAGGCDGNMIVIVD